MDAGTVTLQVGEGYDEARTLAAIEGAGFGASID